MDRLHQALPQETVRPTTERLQCVLCSRVFVLQDTQRSLPPHVYPAGLFKRRRCASTFGVRV